MRSDALSDAALVLVGHGSTVNGDSGAVVYQHAAALRERKVFGAVREAFLKQAPRLTEVVAQLTEPRMFIVPLFMSEGYFSEEVIPRALGLRAKDASSYPCAQMRGAQWIGYCRPVGTHPRVAEAVLARARAVTATAEIEFTASGRRPKKLLVVRGLAKAIGGRRILEDLHLALVT